MIIFIFLAAFLGSLFTSDLQAATEPYRLVILHTNDVHGGIDAGKATFMNPEFPPSLGGAASAARIIRTMRKRAEAEGMGSLLIDTGDIWQGTMVGTKTAGRTVIDYMNAIGYDVTVIGNHEFDAGRKMYEDSCLTRANFPILACNLLDSTAQGMRLYVEPYIIREFNGIKIAIIGLATSETQRFSFAENIRGLYFAPEVTYAQAYVDTVRALGADLVFIAFHHGLPYDRLEAYEDLERWEAEGWTSGYARNAFELARRVPNVDAIFCGHIHVGYQEPWVDPVTHIPCFQGYARGTSIAAIEFEIDPETKTLIRWKPYADLGLLLTMFADEFPREQDIAEPIDADVARVEKGFDEPVGETLVNLPRIGEGETLMGNLVCDAMRWKLQGDVAFTNRGGVRADLSMGKITPRDVFMVLPFQNELVEVLLTGKFLRELFEDKLAFGGSGMFISGLQIEVDRSRPPGNRITVFKIGGKDAEPGRLYRVITTDYLLEGNSGMAKLFEHSDEATPAGVLMRDAMVEYIREHSPLNPKLDGRWKFVQ
ncbi:bifunctional metallophosphatase/5'-nucleotidase [bacterium]|nr:bifunctional metallophosphatase/5'-nucleotidase [bacterium]